MVKPKRYFEIGHNRFLPLDFHSTFINHISRVASSVLKQNMNTQIDAFLILILL
jgi:hypothetical protein